MFFTIGFFACQILSIVNSQIEIEKIFLLQEYLLIGNVIYSKII
jgi:hypothetical protein